MKDPEPAFQNQQKYTPLNYLQFLLEKSNNYLESFNQLKKTSRNNTSSRTLTADDQKVMEEEVNFSLELFKKMEVAYLKFKEISKKDHKLVLKDKDYDLILKTQTNIFIHSLKNFINTNFNKNRQYNPAELTSVELHSQHFDSMLEQEYTDYCKDGLVEGGFKDEFKLFLNQARLDFNAYSKKAFNVEKEAIPFTDIYIGDLFKDITFVDNKKVIVKPVQKSNLRAKIGEFFKKIANFISFKGFKTNKQIKPSKSKNIKQASPGNIDKNNEKLADQDMAFKKLKDEIDEIGLRNLVANSHGSSPTNVTFNQRKDDMQISK